MRLNKINLDRQDRYLLLFRLLDLRLVTLASKPTVIFLRQVCIVIERRCFGWKKQKVKAQTKNGLLL